MFVVALYCPAAEAPGSASPAESNSPPSAPPSLTVEDMYRCLGMEPTAPALREFRRVVVLDIGTCDDAMVAILALTARLFPQGVSAWDDVSLHK